jgi:hypothetical protein
LDTSIPTNTLSSKIQSSFPLIASSMAQPST